jgi:hypothetical protein
MRTIVERLRDAHLISAQYANGSLLLAEAADRIEALEQEVVVWNTRDAMLADTISQNARLFALQEKELSVLREFAASKCTIQKVIGELGPMSLWSKDGLERHIAARTATLTSGKVGK